MSEKCGWARMESARPATRFDDLVDRHPWVAYVLIVLMALLFSIEVG